MKAKANKSLILQFLKNLKGKYYKILIWFNINIGDVCFSFMLNIFEFFFLQKGKQNVQSRIR